MNQVSLSPSEIIVVEFVLALNGVVDSELEFDPREDLMKFKMERKGRKKENEDESDDEDDGRGYAHTHVFK